MDDASGMTPSLRERKKQRTRAMLIEAAVELCLKQGYQQTTVEQIAASADVSTRTFSRYFPTKDAVFLTLLDDYLHAVAVELEAVDPNAGPLEALRRAHTSVLTRIANRRGGRLTGERLVLMLRVVYSSESLKQAAFELRHDLTHEVLAKRMGVSVDDPRASLVDVVFSAAVLGACGDVIPAPAPAAQPVPMIVAARMNEALAEVAQMTRGLEPQLDDYESARG